jgi:hypothetical protein
MRVGNKIIVGDNLFKYPPTSGLKLWLDAKFTRCYPGSGIAAYDLSGNAVATTLYNNIAWSAGSFLFYFKSNIKQRCRWQYISFLGKFIRIPGNKYNKIYFFGRFNCESLLFICSPKYFRRKLFSFVWQCFTNLRKCVSIHNKYMVSRCCYKNTNT